MKIIRYILVLDHATGEISEQHNLNEQTEEKTSELLQTVFSQGMTRLGYLC